MPPSPEPAVLQTVRRLLLALLTIALLGTALDLVLLDHYEDGWQWAPLVMIAFALPAIAWLWRSPTASAVTAVRIIMVLVVATGLAGVLLHLNGSREFQHEIDPSLGGWSLFVKIITAKAPPALAPAAMIQIGLLGLLATYRHPAVRHTSLNTWSE
jgi:hypothetical protein